MELTRKKRTVYDIRYDEFKCTHTHKMLVILYFEINPETNTFLEIQYCNN